MNAFKTVFSFWISHLANPYLSLARKKQTASPLLQKVKKLQVHPILHQQKQSECPVSNTAALVLKAQPLFFSEDAKERWSTQSAAFGLPLIEKLFRSLQDHQDTLEVLPEWPYMYILHYAT